MRMLWGVRDASAIGRGCAGISATSCAGTAACANAMGASTRTAGAQIKAARSTSETTAAIFADG
jgi:hypothetical protein